LGRKVISEARKQKQIENAKIKFAKKSRTRQLYNYLYRRSKFFKASIYIRSITLAFSIFILYFNTLIRSSTTQEILSDCKLDETNFFYKTNARDHKVWNLSTYSNNKYCVSMMNPKREVFFKDDTINVIKNVFGKKTYLVKQREEKLHILIKFSRYNNYLIFVAGMTLFSFMLMDGFDFLSKFVLRFTLFLDITGIILYFIL